MVQDHPALRHAVRDQPLFHHVDLVVVDTAVVTGNQDRPDLALLVQRASDLQSGGQIRRRRAVRMHERAKDQGNQCRGDCGQRVEMTGGLTTDPGDTAADTTTTSSIGVARTWFGNGRVGGGNSGGRGTDSRASSGNEHACSREGPHKAEAEPDSVSLRSWARRRHVPKARGLTRQRGPASGNTPALSPGLPSESPESTKKTAGPPRCIRLLRDPALTRPCDDPGVCGGLDRAPPDCSAPIVRRP
jgi:hypothetical protein